MRNERIVELRFGRQSQGSGYLFTRSHILTARHVVPDEATAETCQVRQRLAPTSPGSGPRWLDVDTLWRPEDPTLDIAVVRLQAALPLADADMPWARVPHGDAYPRRFDGVGFPAAAGNKSHAMWGSLNDLPDASQLDLHLDSGEPQELENWGGASGTVVFCDGAAVGVVKTVDRRWNKLLTATPLHHLLDAPDFQRWWRDVQQLPLPALRSLGAANASPLDPFVEKLHWLDRVDALQETRGYIEELSRARAPAYPAQVLVVPGLQDDLHAKLMLKIADHPGMRRLLGGPDAAATDVLVRLPWPDENHVLDPQAALVSVLQPLFAAAHIDLRGTPEPLALRSLLQQRLDDDGAPFAYWTLLQRAQNRRGHTALLQQLLGFWEGLATRRPVFLFLCVALDEVSAAEPLKPRFSLFQRRAQVPPDADLPEVLEQLLLPLGERCGGLSQLDAIQAHHVDPWIEELQRHPGLRKADLELFGARLKARVGSSGLRLNPLMAALKELLH